ncbi:MAG: hypothetical protein ACRC1K_12415 [Planctomycetia bacterium]
MSFVPNATTGLYRPISTFVSKVALGIVPTNKAEATPETDSLG